MYHVNGTKLEKQQNRCTIQIGKQIYSDEPRKVRWSLLKYHIRHAYFRHIKGTVNNK